MKLLLALLLVCGQAWGETLYLRPSAICANNGDGTAYACAASAGAAGAWNSSSNSNVLWGSGAAKVSAGDTLYVCGRVTDFSLVPTISGTTGNNIVLSGACPSDPGYLSGGANNNFSIDIEVNKSYFTIEYLTIGWAKRNALFVGVADSAGANLTDFIVRYNTINNVEATTTANVCHAVYFNSITGTAALYRINNVQFYNNIVTGTGAVCANGNNDGVNMENLGTGALIHDNEVYGGHEGFDISTGTGIVFERNYTHDNTYSGVKFHGIMGCGTGNRASANIIADNPVSGFIWQDQMNGFVLDNTIKHAGTLHGLDIESVNTWAGSCVPAGNTYANNYISADYVAGAARIYNTSKATFESGNTWNGNVLRQVGSNTTLIYWTSDTGNNITTSNFAANWSPSHAKDKQQSNPLWVGGSAPTTANGFRPGQGSPLLSSGITVWPVKDYRGCIFDLGSPNIGAYSSCAGDPAPTRSAAP